MSQLNLKQVLSGDTVSTVVDKINYNFDQIVLNGGGPRGFTGLIGAPGLIGRQGLMGETGPTGPDGTHLYASGLTPGGYPFGTGGETLPRLDDVFLEGGTSYINIWTAATGASGLEWNLEATITAPGGGLSKIVLDSFNPGFGAGATFTSFANDPNVGGEFLLGSPEALFSSLVIDPAFNINSATPKKVPALSSLGDPVAGNSTLTVVSAQNQLRLLNFDTYFMDSSRVSQEGGGIVHNIETDTDPSGATVQIYRIQNGDTEGNKHFNLSFSGSLLNVGDAPSLFYSDIAHRALIGGSNFSTLVARLSINSSLAVGRRTIPGGPFYQGATLSTGTIATPMGAVIEGNLAIGKNNNSLATAGFYNLGVNDGVPSTNLIIDAAEGSAANAFSELQISSGFYSNMIEAPGSNNNWWKFKHVATNSFVNPLFTGLRLSGYSSIKGGSADTMYFTLVENGDGDLAGTVRPRVGVNNINPISLFEVGASATRRIGMGDFQPLGGSANHFLSFNLHRSHTYPESWTRRGSADGNAGRTLWASETSGIGISLFQSTSTSSITNITDAQVTAATKLYLSPSGWLTTSPVGDANRQQGYPAVFNFGTNNTVAGSTAGVEPSDNNSYTSFRRYVAQFGNGYSQNIKGSPLIAATFGLTATAITGDSIFPQYTFHNDFSYGFYIAGGTSANAMTGVEVGIAVGGTAGITVLGGYGSQQVSPRLGVNNRAPLSDVHVGKNITISESSTGIYQNFIGYNFYYDFGVGANRRIEGSPILTNNARGAAAIQFIEKLSLDTTTPEVFGTTIRLFPAGLGATGATFSDAGIPGASTDTITPYVSIAPNVLDPFNLVNENQVPTVRIGIGATDSTGSSVIGSLATAARSRSSFSIYDYYNLTLYSEAGRQGVGMRATNDGSGTRTFSLEYKNVSVFGLSAIPLLSSSYNENNSASLKTAAFGNDFRVGLDGTVSSDAAFYSKGSTTSPVGGATAAAKFDGDILIGEDANGVFDIRTGGDPQGWVTYTMANSDCAYVQVGNILRAVNMTGGTKETLYKRIGKTCFMDVFLNNVNTSDPNISNFYIKLPPGITPSSDFSKFTGNGFFSNSAAPGYTTSNDIGRSGVWVSLTGSVSGLSSGWWAIVNITTFKNFYLGGDGGPSSNNLTLRYSITFELS
jgi:hypothetical protein